MSKLLRKRVKGFTLVELMIVVAIIGILAAIAIPRFANLIDKSKEGATKGSLGALRSAVGIYYGDNEGAWPQTINSTQFYGVSKYIEEIPQTKLGSGTGHGDTSAVVTAQGDAGGWFYASTTGTLVVNCTHTDLSPKALKISSW